MRKPCQRMAHLTGLFQVFAASLSGCRNQEYNDEIHKTGKLPVVNFAAGGVATPADAALMMQLGADGVFVGSGIFHKTSDPEARARAIVKATTHYQDPEIIAEASKNLGEAMPGLDIKQIPSEELLASRGW